MAINVKFDLTNNPETPTIILANRSGNKLGQLDVDPKTIELSDKFNDASEITFTLNKYVDGKLTNLWDKVVDFKLIYCKEWDMWFEIRVELDEATKSVKTVFCTQLGQAELSQIMIYNMTINQEGDSNWDKTDENSSYKKTILFNPNDESASLLHRILKDKAPHYSIKHVDSTIANIQRMFDWDGTSIYDAFMEIAKEIGCLFIFHSNSDKNGKIQRMISVYDLQQNCLNKDCAHRGEFTDKCPKCGQTNIKYGYGEDTTIFVTADELANEGIQLTTDTDSVKNCFKLEAGDDLITATIRNCNPNGTDYIWYFSEDMKSDMSKELVNKIESYDVIYKEYYNNHESKLDSNILNKYNALVEKYKPFYNTASSICYNCGCKGDFDDTCSECKSNNIYVGEKLQGISTPIKGYSALMNVYYNTVDLALYLESGLMPSITIAETDAEEQAGLLASDFPSTVAVGNKTMDSVSLSTADSAVLSMAKVIVKSTFKVEIKDNSSSLSGSGENTTWTGSFVITNYSDEEDVYTTGNITVKINNDMETFLQQKIDKALNKDNTENVSISGLFAEDVEVDDNGNFSGKFYDELKKYALNPLKSFYDACETCLSILQEQGVANGETWSDNTEGSDANLYEKLYTPYYNKLNVISSEMSIRENELAIIKGVYKTDEDGNKVLDTEGIEYYINKCKNEIQSALNFEDYIGDDLWVEFCSYRREDKYSNDNYISDGLNNAELFNKAKEFIKVAEDELYKSAELQHSISTTLKNLLAIPKFKPLVEHFSVGNWIRVRVDEQVYKLRLLEYSISYDSFESIPVTFSDVTKVKTGVTDLQSVLSQASSMATSYSSVQKQASQGENAKGTVDQWLANGLNSAQVRIQSNNTEDIIFDRNGLLCRSYNEITDTYDPEQLKITHNIIAYTSDNWESVKQAIGKHNYIEYSENESKFVDKVGYGLTADFVTAGIVTGSQIIGGDIYSDNYSVANNTGSYLNLRNGTFSFGGGSLRFEGGKLIINSPDIPTKNTITEINEEYLKTTSVYAENLQVNSAKIQGTLTAKQINIEDIITVGGIAETSDIPTNISQLNNDEGYETASSIKNTVITKDYIETLNIRAGSVAAENITGTTISGKTLSGISGEIGGWTINPYNLYSSDGTNTVYLNNDGSIVLRNKDGYVTHKGYMSTYGYGDNSSSVDITGSGINFNFKAEAQSINFYDSNNNTISCLTYYGISDGNNLSRLYFEKTGRTEVLAKTDLYLKCDGVQSDDIGRSLVFRYTDNAATAGSTTKEPFFMPCKTDVTNLGGVSYKWKDIYATNGIIQTSDRNQKKDIKILNEKYIKLFDLLEPVSFKFVDGTTGRTHIGFIAQDVEDAMKKIGLTSLDFAGLCKNTIIDNNKNQIDVYSLRYGEFVALNTAKIKQLEQLVLELRNEIKELKS